MMAKLLTRDALAAMRAAWAKLQADGMDHGPDHCPDCATDWAPIVGGLPLLLDEAEERRVRAGAEEELA